jgi:hypothetical protein
MYCLDNEHQRQHQLDQSGALSRVRENARRATRTLLKDLAELLKKHKSLSTFAIRRAG